MLDFDKKRGLGCREMYESYEIGFRRMGVIVLRVQGENDLRNLMKNVDGDKNKKMMDDFVWKLWVFVWGDEGKWICVKFWNWFQ